MTKVTTLEQLDAKLKQLMFGPEKILIMADIADALAKPVDGKTESNDGVLSRQSFWNYFSNVLLVHHATNEDKFKKKAFEFAFRGACVAEGLKAVISASQTNPGADVTVGAEKYSLKTEADQKISRTSIKISKLMEARWIRELQSNPNRGSIAATNILHHLAQYGRILTLRAFDIPNASSRTHVLYELWEIPKSVLEKIGSLTNGDFSDPTTNNSFSVVVKASEGGNIQRVFTLRMDGSVEKITISGLATKYCVKHAHWRVPVEAASEEDNKEFES